MIAIPKPGGDAQLKHDYSRPTGRAVNDYCTSDWHQQCCVYDENNCYFAKVGLRSAYRSLSVNVTSQKVTGFKDTKLPFGENPRPGIFCRLT